MEKNTKAKYHYIELEQKIDMKYEFFSVLYARFGFTYNYGTV